ncbi:MAG: mannosyltransferase [Icmadophila ericetorum]|nr:mannosyltransferase [Icmadophila ericetorum]
MQYHAISVAKRGGLVDLIGYRDSELHPEVLAQSSIVIHAIPKVPRSLYTKSKSLFLVYGPLKVLFQIWSIWLVVGYRTKPAKWLLVQNPPSIPTLAIARIVCFLRNTRLIIDWHNFGYSILALRLGDRHPLVSISKWYERFFSHSAYAHFTVTEAMARILKRDYPITNQANIFPLHDRPFGSFKPLTPIEGLTFLGRLPETTSSINAIALETLKVVVSSTSWTPDEDFSLLLSALTSYSDFATTTHPHLPELLVIITGKGPQKEFYAKKIFALKQEGKLEMVTIKTAWLSTEDYAALLGSADLGVSLHTSSSGVDLPMKVVDMFGSGLPVVGWSKFEAWPELVQEGVNGRGFESAEGLRDVLVSLLGDVDGRELEGLKRGAVMESRRGWDEEWDVVAGRVLGVVE